MKRLLIPLTALIVAAIGWQLASPSADQHNPSDQPPVSKQTLPTSTVTDPALVFQKAFWKRPTSEDQILQAERREWEDKDGLSKWQWFIAVKPSAALVDHLITNNAFMLTASPRGGGREYADAPDWFSNSSTDEAQILANTSGTFYIFWDKNAELLRATDSGSGFRPGAPAPAKPLTAAQPEGRLPNTPPPRP